MDLSAPLFHSHSQQSICSTKNCKSQSNVKGQLSLIFHKTSTFIKLAVGIPSSFFVVWFVSVPVWWCVFNVLCRCMLHPYTHGLHYYATTCGFVTMFIPMTFPQKKNIYSSKICKSWSNIKGQSSFIWHKGIPASSREASKTFTQYQHRLNTNVIGEYVSSFVLFTSHLASEWWAGGLEMTKMNGDTTGTGYMPNFGLFRPDFLG